MLSVRGCELVKNAVFTKCEHSRSAKELGDVAKEERRQRIGDTKTDDDKTHHPDT